MSIFNAYTRLSGATDATVKMDEPLSRHSSYGIGGPAALYVAPHSVSALITTLDVLQTEDVPWVVLGRGSNVLVADEGYFGCAIELTGEFNALNCDFETHTITAGAATLLSSVVRTALAKGLSGLEMCGGIPGTIGGACFMNAGSRYKWVSEVITSVVTYRLSEHALHRYSASELNWDYRSSSFAEDEIILELTFTLRASSKDKVAKLLQQRLDMRKASQPLHLRSCGSVFKNPSEGTSVAKLIENVGLKGYRFGGAQVSHVHANFIVNIDSARASDIVHIMREIYNRVEDRYGIKLEPEVKFLGFQSQSNTTFSSN